jgi:hypothetical protein
MLRHHGKIIIFFIGLMNWNKISIVDDGREVIFSLSDSFSIGVIVV